MKKTLLLISIFSTVFLTGCNDSDSQPTFEEQLAIDEGIIESYLTTNNISAQEHESGIRYVINTRGIGDQPAEGDRVAVKYTSYNLQGTNLGEDQIGFTLDLDTDLIIESWVLMLPEILEGGKITIYSPSGYVFGTTGSGSVPPNEIVVFEIELLAVIDSEEEQLTVDIGIIDEFIGENNIIAQTDPSGLRYVVEEEGTGESPTIENNVRITYEVTLLNGTVVDRNTTGEDISLQSDLGVYQKILPLMKEGGKVKVYAPSQFGYGTTGSSSLGILPNTILIFEIDFREIRA